MQFNSLVVFLEMRSCLVYRIVHIFLFDAYVIIVVLYIKDPEEYTVFRTCTLIITPKLTTKSDLWWHIELQPIAS